jgi:hypothetical protein
MGLQSGDFVNDFLEQGLQIQGDFAEIGVYGGDNFKRLLLGLKGTGRVLHAFDSFQGLPAPGLFDIAHLYPEGAFNVGGVDAFRQIMADMDPEGYRIWPGFIPECFPNFDQEIRKHFCFAAVLINMVHYGPTLDAIRWAWPKLHPGGLLVIAEYLPKNRPGYLSTRAVLDWFKTSEGQSAENIRRVGMGVWMNKPGKPEKAEAEEPKNETKSPKKPPKDRMIKEAPESR